MSILRTREAWQRPGPTAKSYGLTLTADEQANVRAALRFLCRQRGGSKKLGAVMGVHKNRIDRAMTKPGRPSAALALACARIAGVCVGAILAGAWPSSGACPHCGRSGPVT